MQFELRIDNSTLIKRTSPKILLFQLKQSPSGGGQINYTSPLESQRNFNKIIVELFRLIKFENKLIVSLYAVNYTFSNNFAFQFKNNT